MSSDALLVLSTCPDSATADGIARALVDERLAACVNRVDGVTSIWRWQGGTEQAGECLLLIKTTGGAFERLEARLKALHPYELPELLAVPVERGSTAYLRWLAESIA